jgi:hypothetical protein
MQFSAHLIRALAVEARRDPRTVQRVIAGRGRGLANLCVRDAAAKLGIELPDPGSSEPSNANGAPLQGKGAVAETIHEQPTSHTQQSQPDQVP